VGAGKRIGAAVPIALGGSLVDGPAPVIDVVMAIGVGIVVGVTAAEIWNTAKDIASADTIGPEPLLYRKGERNRTGKPDGTNNPGKKFRYDAKNGRWRFQDENGKWHDKSPGWEPPDSWGLKK
jgi:hypothetical protein